MTAPSDETFHFAGFSLLARDGRLTRDGREVPLTPKAFAVLVFLCQQAGRLVTKDELLNAVWGHLHITEGVIKNTIQELRRALGDDPRAPRHIETVHRRGYRFIAPLADPAAAEPTLPALPSPAAPAVVGRDAPLRRLAQALELARAGRPQIVFVSGEPGIGKTTLVQAFHHGVAREAACFKGQCVDHRGQAEPYLPVLEVLNQIGHRDTGPLTETLARYAPTWLAQMPWLLGETGLTGPGERDEGVTQTRMLREFAAFLEHWSAERVLVLVLEDVHWCDNATLDLLTYLARRQARARWMIVATYRPVDVIVRMHPLKEVRQELLAQGLAQDLPLELLSEAAVAEYLDRRFGAGRLSEPVVRALHRRTEGLPLFLTRLADELEAGPAVAGDHSLAAVEAFLRDMPEGLRYLIEHQIERLPAVERQLLDAGAVCGGGFSVAALAAVTGMDLLAAEDGCERLARVWHLLRGSGQQAELRAAGRYDFVHAYYQELAYQGVAPGRRAELHRRVGAWFEAIRAPRRSDLAAELAQHFEAGQDYAKAVHYLGLAAENAEHRHAPHEVIHLLRRALALLDHLPRREDGHETDDRIRQRLELLASLATAIQTTQGFAAADLAPIYQQTLEYTRQLGDTSGVQSLIWGAWGYHCTRADFPAAAALVGLMRHAIAAGGDPAWRIGTHVAQGGVHWHQGELDAARSQLENAQALYGPDTRPELYRVYTQDPDVLCRFFLGMLEWLQGHPQRALETVALARARGQALGHPFTQAFALWADTMVSQARGEVERVEALGGEMGRMAREHGFTMLSAMADMFQGWARSARGETENGIAALRDGLVLLRATGARMMSSYFPVLLADAHLRAGQTEAGLAVLEEALAAVQNHGERFFEAEIWRVQGALLQRRDDLPAAEGCYRRALELAQAQGARSLQLRAAVSLGHLWREQGQPARARQVVGEACAGFDAGLDLADLILAKSLLEQLAA